MKFIKTIARNNVTEIRLNGLSLLAIERDFAVHYEKKIYGVKVLVQYVCSIF
jgi:hypothetical protein